MLGRWQTRHGFPQCAHFAYAPEPQQALCRWQFPPGGQHIASIGANLVLHTGDISLDGSAQEDDLIEAKRLHEVVDPPLRFIPGNHDIGESQEAPGHAGLLMLSALTRER